MKLEFPGEAARRQRVERRKQRMQEQAKRKPQKRAAKKPLKGTERSLAYSREYYRRNRESCLAYGRWYRAMAKKRKQQLKSGG